MPNVVILIYGEGRHLVPKPADYESLLDVARVKFPELYDFDLNNITFHITPEWFDGEVELDRKAFAEVHDRGVIRIITTPSATLQPPHNLFMIQNDSVSATDPYEMQVLPLGRVKLDFVHVPTDFTVTYAIKTTQKFRRLMAHMATLLDFDIDSTEFIFDYEVLEINNTPQDLGMANYDFIEVYDLV